MTTANAVPADMRGTPQKGIATNPGRVIATPYRLDEERRIGIQSGELGDGTPIFSVCIIWASQQYAISGVNEFCYTFPAIREWIQKKYRPLDTLRQIKVNAANPLPSPPF